MPDETPSSDGQFDDRPDPRTGEDSRRRGWFWHWNSIVTQYAPLIGLKGVGLLNSYTVWTDRREDSPHRGYAFPSQQSEAHFYGEDRAELITINKILVALDLIEVRKEMVLHVDDRGRRWRVPHNLYRVKDSPNGFNLTVDDVLRIAELAAKTPAVYRYVRRIFSPNFAPIDRKNPWNEILPAVRQTEVWQKLSARAAREDARASARSKAGHRKRKGNSQTSRHDDSSSAETDVLDVAQPERAATSVEPDNNDQTTSVRDTSNGSDDDVDETNRGFARIQPTDDGPVNEGGPSVVQPANTTYNQDVLNTTRTTTSENTSVDDDQSKFPQPPDDQPASGPVMFGSTATLVAFEAANDRPASALERELLGELERDFADAAQRAGHSAAEWVVRAIREAVNSGSRFVAPKRVREILNRWSTTEARELRSDSKARPIEKSPAVSDQPQPETLGIAWREIIRELEAGREWADLGDTLAESVLLGEENGRIRIGLRTGNVTDEDIHHAAHVAEVEITKRLGYEVTVDVERPGSNSGITSSGDSKGASHRSGASPPGAVPVPCFEIVDGLSNTQLWAAAEQDLRAEVSSANFETWIRPASLIGIDESGRLVLGVPSQFAMQRVASKLRDDIQTVLSRIVGQPVVIEVVVAQQWLRNQREKPRE